MSQYCETCCIMIPEGADDAIKCAQCYKWYHGQCSFPALDKDVIEMMKLLNHMWVCDECSFGKPCKVPVSDEKMSSAHYLCKISELKTCVKCMQESSEHLMTRLEDSNKLIADLNQKVDFCNKNINRLMEQNRKMKLKLKNLANNSSVNTNFD